MACHLLFPLSHCSLLYSLQRHQPVSYKYQNSAPLTSRAAHTAACQASHRPKHLINSPTQRRSANYPPSLWNDNYIRLLRSEYMEEKEEVHQSRIEKLKKKVRNLIHEDKELIDQLELVDALQQLGVAHHFEEEIKYVMATIYSSMENINKNDLYITALLFRLLRDNGFDISQDIFINFKDAERHFKTNIHHDSKGILSLYEASHLGMEGEGILDDARDFTTTRLKNFLKGGFLEPFQQEQVAYALERPLHWRMQRLHTRWFIDVYARRENMNPMLLELANIDFNLAQSMYRRELRGLSRWWTDQGFSEGKMDFFRDRLVENYFWTVGWAFEPQFWRSRQAMTKANCFITLIDDVYDVYGTLDELELFTDAIVRWDVDAIDRLPQYMKTCFLAVFNTTNGTSYEILKDKGVNVIPFLKASWADLCKTYLVEARWYHKGYMPTLKEYLDNAWISISGHVILTHAYCASEHITSNALDNFDFYSNIVRCSSMLLRLYNDLATSTAELARGDVQKSLQCYMHETNVSEAMSRKHIKNLISNTWKELNGCRIPSLTFEESFKRVALNIPRISQCIYGDGDGYGQCHAVTKSQIISLLIDPIPI